MYSLSPLSSSSPSTGLLWSKQFYHYDVKKWLGEGEATALAGEGPRLAGRNSSTDWAHLINNDVISMPDKWEYPWVIINITILNIIIITSILIIFLLAVCVLGLGLPHDSLR